LQRITRLVLTPLLIATLAVAPAPSPTPDIVQLPNQPFTVPETPPTVSDGDRQTMKWLGIAGGAAVLAILLFTRPSPGCNNNADTNDDNDLIGDALPRKPTIGLTLHFPIP
jgi:hypothetical protein